MAPRPKRHTSKGRRKLGIAGPPAKTAGGWPKRSTPNRATASGCAVIKTWPARVTTFEHRRPNSKGRLTVKSGLFESLPVVTR
jgi:hypothetical protein